jgi:hypothetical protein
VPLRVRKASCACKSLQVAVKGEPRNVYACSCLECQRATGSAFAYRAVFATAMVDSISGQRSKWRRSSDSGRWVEQTFCPVCGTLVYMEAEGLKDAISVSVGCFEERDFPAPTTFHRTNRRHQWYTLTEAVSG